MHITKIELEDFKSHADSKFEFTSGTTAITGENGAGKTSIIEAIAWTLFDTLEYKKEDIVRRGAKKGVARVTFESGLDEREYTVYRDTGAGYYVYDPRLKTRIADKKEEVTRFLWQHLGVEPGTDLASLFNHAIGVPQGTFTAIFLATAAERKRTFDSLLKVEEYRRGADELLKTSRYLDNQVAVVRENIARTEGELGRTEEIEAEHKKIAAEAAEISKTFESVDRETAAKAQSVQEFDEVARKVETLRIEFEKLNSDASKLEIHLAQKERDLNAATEAAEKIKQAEADNKQHLAALARLHELEQERAERDKLRTELSKVETALVNVKAEQKRSKDDLETALKAHQTIEKLKPQVAEQIQIEQRLDHLRNELAATRAAANQTANLAQRLVRLREVFAANQAQMREAESKGPAANDVNELQKRDSAIVQQMAQLRAALERDEKFQAEIKNGLCPILSQKCLNLKEGETLDGFVSSQFSELRSQIAAFENEQKSVAANLSASRDAEKFVATLPTLRLRVAEIEDEGKRLRAEHESLQKEAESLPTLETDFARIEAQLAALDNPKARIKLLEKEATREFDLREAITKIESNLERLESDRMTFDEQMEKYKDLDSQWTQFAGERDATFEARRIYLANESLAVLFDVRKKDFEESKAESSRLAEALQSSDKLFIEAGSGYDRERHLAEQAELLASERRKAELGATLKAKQDRENDLAAEIARLAEKRKAMQDEFRKKERLEKIAETTTFIRETLKEAAPRVARNYVHHVSLEANLMFREISGNAEHTLKWNEDYGIALEEGGYDRPFTSLSGGEQMAAALSVRLALLKQLSDIRIAFFDEPTTNMDAERRERLAEQIGRIKYFEQLFVISHDDTFEGYMDNEIHLGD
ncbi:MAG: SMC family ATPase [Pyrinomonadaceae bacterium]